MKTVWSYDGNSSISHTRNGPDEWWEVDLGQDYAADKIVIWNGNSHDPNRIANAAL